MARAMNTRSRFMKLAKDGLMRDPETLQRGRELADSLVDELLELPDPTRTQLLTSFLDMHTMVHKYADDPGFSDTLNQANIYEKSNEVTAAVNACEEAGRPPEQIARCIQMIDELLTLCGRLSDDMRAEFTAPLYELREALANPQEPEDDFEED